MSASQLSGACLPASQKPSFKSLIEITAISRACKYGIQKIKTINKNMGCIMSAPFCFGVL